MGWWNSKNIEPKRAVRFLMSLAGPGTDTLASYYIKSVKKPNFSIEGTQEVKYIGHTFKYPGRVKWEDLTVTVIDPGSPDATGIIMNILANSGYKIPVNVQAAKESLTKAGTSAAMGAIKISQINALGKSVETWNLVNPFLSGVDFGEVSYDNDEIVNYTLTITYDSATLWTDGTTVHNDVKSKST